MKVRRALNLKYRNESTIGAFYGLNRYVNREYVPMSLCKGHVSVKGEAEGKDGRIEFEFLFSENKDTKVKHQVVS